MKCLLHTPCSHLCVMLYNLRRKNGTMGIHIIVSLFHEISWPDKAFTTI